MSDSIIVTVPRDYCGTLKLSLSGDRPPPEPPVPTLSPDRDSDEGPWQEDPPARDDDTSLISHVTRHRYQGRTLYSCGHDTPHGHLNAISEFVRQTCLGELYQAVVLNEWTGEVTLAVGCGLPEEVERVLYAISDWRGCTAEQIEVAERDGAHAIQELCQRNIGPAASVKMIPQTPMALVSGDKQTQHGQYDLIVINSEENPDLLRELVRLWSVHLKDTGFILGQAVTEEEQNAVARVFGPRPRQLPETSIWYYAKSEVPLR